MTVNVTSDKKDAIRKRSVTKGIFCVEGLWDPDLRVQSTVRPLLELLRLHESVEYIHREYAVRDELEFYIQKWSQKRYALYPILYVTGHGVKNGLQLGKEIVTLDELAALIQGHCTNRLIMLSSCSTLHIDRKQLRKFLRKTGALAVCGYKVTVDWMRSTAFELLLLSQMQDSEFSVDGAETIAKQARRTARSFKDLEFIMLTGRSLSRGRSAQSS